VVNSTPHKRGANLSVTQFLVTFNPIIVGWDPFNWNTLISYSVDSFYVYKLPYSEDCLLHLGMKRNYYSKDFLSNNSQYFFNGFFIDMYYRPYKIDKENIQYMFQTFNIQSGYQFSFIKKNLPILGTFLWGFSLQFDYMNINESENSLNSFSAIVGLDKYLGTNYLGAGAKFIVQMKNLNIYIEGRQYYAINENFYGAKFTHNPIILVGANISANFIKRKSKINNSEIIWR
jgi:hypothetical protein